MVAVYATFLNRAFDQVLLDVAMHRLPVTFVLDRAGITGPDGPSHYGIWDMASSASCRACGSPPRATPPRCARSCARRSPSTTARPIVRFPTGSVAGRPARAAPGRRRSTCCAEAERKDVLLVAVGAFGQLGMEVADRLAEQGYGVTVVDPRWVRPVPVELVGLAAEHRLVVTRGGRRTGRRGRRRGRRARCATPASTCRCATSACRPGCHPHGTRAEILAALGLTAQDVARDVTEWMSQLEDAGRGAPAQSASSA